MIERDRLSDHAAQVSSTHMGILCLRCTSQRRLLIAVLQWLRDTAAVSAISTSLAAVAINTYYVMGHAISLAASPALLSGSE